jgi:hypothetical protein
MTRAGSPFSIRKVRFYFTPSAETLEVPLTLRFCPAPTAQNKLQSSTTWSDGPSGRRRCPKSSLLGFKSSFSRSFASLRLEYIRDCSAHAIFPHSVFLLSLAWNETSLIVVVLICVTNLPSIFRLALSLSSFERPTQTDFFLLAPGAIGAVTVLASSLPMHRKLLLGLAAVCPLLGCLARYDAHRAVREAEQLRQLMYSAPEA